MDKEELIRRAEELAEQAAKLAHDALELGKTAGEAVVTGAAPDPVASGGHDFISLFTVFVLAIFVGYYVVWSVTPALHSPLMGVTNAISSVIIVGALIAAGPEDMNVAKIFGFIAVLLASVNIFGGFIVTQRMLQMFKKKPKKS